MSNFCEQSSPASHSEYFSKSQITFVSAYYTLRETPYFNSHPDPQSILELARTGVQLCLYIGTECVFESVFLDLEKECPNFRVMPYRIYYKDMWVYKHTHVKLPDARNVEKDTVEYMVYMHSRPEIMEDAISENPWDSTHFAWIDFNAAKLFSNKSESFKRLKEIANYNFPETSCYFAGCWPKLDEAGAEKNIATNIHWRFCGAFYLADVKSHLSFAETYRTNFAVFLEQYSVFPWEVNYWAWLEYKCCGWKPVWYKGDHNDKMLNILSSISADTYATPLTNFSNSCEQSSPELDCTPTAKHPEHCSIKTYEYPAAGSFLPGSASYLNYGGVHYLNTRFVNYWMYPSGYYRFHNQDCVIENKNFMSRLDPVSMEPVDFKEMDDSELGLVRPAREKRPFSVGLEDIRLFSGLKDGHEIVRFIATNVEYSENNKARMIVGTCDFENATYRDCSLIIPPDPNSWCEKNWIPVRQEDEERFIYKWSPMEIGRINPSTNQLDIVVRYEVNCWLFERLRGSTTFVDAPGSIVPEGLDSEYLVGVAHFSEEHSPRHYYHVLILLEKTTLKPVRYSRVFYFEKLSIEFCIGFSVAETGFMFWISRFDREPAFIEIDLNSLILEHLV